jgi:hypothetical protein
MKLLSVILVVILIPLGFVQGQTAESPFTPIWKSGELEEVIIPYTLSWSNDSAILYFAVNNILFNTERKQYEVATASIDDVSAPPRTIQLSEDQQRSFHAWNSTGYIAPDQDTFIYVSTYQIGSRVSESNLYAFGTLSDSVFLPSRVSAFDPLNDRFRWSDDSSTLVIETSAPYGGIEVPYYIKSQKSGNCWCAFVETRLPMDLNTGDAIYDLSPNGERLLYPAYRNTIGYWDVNIDTTFGQAKDTGIFLPLENVIGAAFLPDTQDEILAVNEVGIIRYDVKQRQSVVIDPKINSKWANWAMFSPDNQWVAVLAGGEPARKELFVLPVTPTS